MQTGFLHQVFWAGLAAWHRPGGSQVQPRASSGGFWPEDWPWEFEFVVGDGWWWLVMVDLFVQSCNLSGMKSGPMGALLSADVGTQWNLSCPQGNSAYLGLWRLVHGLVHCCYQRRQRGALTSGLCRVLICFDMFRYVLIIDLWHFSDLCWTCQVLKEQRDLLIVVSGAKNVAPQSVFPHQNPWGIHFGMRLSEVPNRPIHEEACFFLKWFLNFRLPVGIISPSQVVELHNRTAGALAEQLVGFMPWTSGGLHDAFLLRLVFWHDGLRCLAWRSKVLYWCWCWAASKVLWRFMQLSPFWGQDFKEHHSTVSGLDADWDTWNPHFDSQGSSFSNFKAKPLYCNTIVDASGCSLRAGYGFCLLQTASQRTFDPFRLETVVLLSTCPASPVPGNTCNPGGERMFSSMENRTL